VVGQRRDLPATRPGMLWEASGTGESVGSVRGRPSVWTALRLAVPGPLGGVLPLRLPALPRLGALGGRER
jgi:hypothetical protein